MDVVALSPVPVASLRWRLGEGPWMLAVACKLTVDLEPGECELSKRCDPIHTADLDHAEVPRERILAASDLVPARPRVDVTALPAWHRAGRELRLALGGIDKRVASRGGLCIELCGHAAGTEARPGSSVPADGCALPEGFDLGVFCAAPSDQRSDDLQPDAELLLDHLHAEHPHLRSRLPDAAPQLFVDRRGTLAELPMRIDAAFIDGGRGVITLTFRGQVPVAAGDKAFIAVAGPGRRLNAAQIAERIDSLRGVARVAARSDPPDELEETIRTRRDATDTVTAVRLPAQPEQVVLRFVERINSHDPDGLAHLMSEAHRFVDATGQTQSGRETLRAAWREYLTAFPDYRIEVAEQLVAGRAVALFGFASGRYAGAAKGAGAWRIPAAWRAIVRDGLVDEWRVWCDAEPILRSMGVKRFESS